MEFKLRQAAWGGCVGWLQRLLLCLFAPQKVRTGTTHWKQNKFCRKAKADVGSCAPLALRCLQSGVLGTGKAVLTSNLKTLCFIALCSVLTGQLSCWRMGVEEGKFTPSLCWERHLISLCSYYNLLPFFFIGMLWGGRGSFRQWDYRTLCDWEARNVPCGDTPIACPLFQKLLHVFDSGI